DQWRRRKARDRANGGAKGSAFHGTGVATLGLRIGDLVATEGKSLIAAGWIQRELVEVARFEARASQFARDGGCRLLVIEDACHDSRHVMLPEMIPVRRGPMTSG